VYLKYTIQYILASQGRITDSLTPFASRILPHSLATLALVALGPALRKRAWIPCIRSTMAVAGRLRGRVRICLRCRIGFYKAYFERVFLLFKTDYGRTAVGGSGGGGRAGRLGVAVGVWGGCDLRACSCVCVMCDLKRTQKTNAKRISHVIGFSKLCSLWTD
jgi:hypothetical protein